MNREHWRNGKRWSAWKKEKERVCVCVCLFLCWSLFFNAFCFLNAEKRTLKHHLLTQQNQTSFFCCTRKHTHAPIQQSILVECVILLSFFCTVVSLLNLNFSACEKVFVASKACLLSPNRKFPHQFCSRILKAMWIVCCVNAIKSCETFDLLRNSNRLVWFNGNGRFNYVWTWQRPSHRTRIFLIDWIRIKCQWSNVIGGNREYLSK